MPVCAATMPIGKIRSPTHTHTHTHTHTAISPPCALMKANHTITSHEVKWPILEATDGGLAGKWLLFFDSRVESCEPPFPSVNYI